MPTTPRPQAKVQSMFELVEPIATVTFSELPNDAPRRAAGDGTRSSATTDPGRKTKERIEALTDELAAAAYDVLSAHEIERVIRQWPGPPDDLAGPLASAHIEYHSRAGADSFWHGEGKENVMPGAVIIGVGPGIGLSAARRFARGGMPVSVIARTLGTIEAAAETLRRDGAQVTGLLADSTDADALCSALDTAEGRYGVPDVLVYNAALVRRDRLGELSTAQLLGSWAVNVGGVVTAAAHTGSKMASAGHGTLIITGGLPEPLAESFSLSLGKAGVRTLAVLLDQELGPSGVHVTTVTVHGGVRPGSAFDPDEIAETYWQLYRQPREEWMPEVAYTGAHASPRSGTGKPSASGR